MVKPRQNLNQSQAQQELPDGISPALLKALHILTRDGALNADSRRKLKQVMHLLGLLQPAMEDVLARVEAPVVVDCGAGKGYLGFLLAQKFLGPAGKGRMLNVETRPELCTRAAAVAKEAGLQSVEFVQGAVESAPLPEHVHLLTALHACDTATDDALVAAIAHNVDHVAVVPCCQAEVAQQLKGAKSEDPALALLHGHPLHRRELGAHLTNVVRSLALEAFGYVVTVTELVGWEHSLKNELILGRKTQRHNPRAREQLRVLLNASGVRPKLVRVLEERGLLTLEAPAPATAGA